MDLIKLSQLCSYSTQEIHRLTTELYEELHDAQGSPEIGWEKVILELRSYKTKVSLELDSIKTALNEYNELNQK
tara:strand:+ start:578 stop:799 length:222 start_codon:yes stop_codon:yes gene_type:complete